MAVTIVSDEILLERGIEEVVLVDSLGRQKHLQISMLDGPDPDAFITQEIAAFEAQEAALTQYMSKRGKKPKKP